LTLTAAAYTFSVFVKKQTRNFFAISTYDGSTTLEGYFNINTGAVATMPAGLTGSIVSYGNGWYRCSVTRTMGANANNYFAFNAAPTDGGSTYTGTSAIACSLYGATIELGAYATSYIPTLGTSVTRVADAASKTGISSLIGQTEGAFMIDVNLDVRTNYTYFALAPNIGVTSDYLGIGFKVTSIVFESVVGSGLQAGITFNNSATGRFKIAVAYKANDFVMYVNGALVGTDTSGTLPACSEIGLYQYDQTQYIKYNEALLFKTRLTNAQLAELTTL
jgi:hypothetical protein